MDLAFLHIGMIKTGSTYMQNVWLNDPSYGLSHRTNVPFVEALRDAVRQENTNQYIPWNVALDEGTLAEHMVISHEAFSTAFMNEAEHYTKIPLYIDYVSRNLGRLSEVTQNVLLLVREPMSWIRSTYNQFIKQGGKENAQEFVNSSEEFLKHSLDLGHIIGCYRRYFGNVLTLPHEILREDESQFWDVVSSTFGVPTVTTRFANAVNSSLDLKRLYILHLMNQNPEPMKRLMASLGDKSLLQDYMGNSVNINRMYVESANEKGIDTLYDFYEISEPAQGFLDFKLPNTLERAVQEKYIRYISEYVSHACGDLYAQRL